MYLLVNKYYRVVLSKTNINLSGYAKPICFRAIIPCNHINLSYLVLSRQALSERSVEPFIHTTNVFIIFIAKLSSLLAASWTKTKHPHRPSLTVLRILRRIQLEQSVYYRNVFIPVVYDSSEYNSVVLHPLCCQIERNSQKNSLCTVLSLTFSNVSLWLSTVFQNRH